MASIASSGFGANNWTLLKYVVQMPRLETWQPKEIPARSALQPPHLPRLSASLPAVCDECLSIRIMACVDATLPQDQYLYLGNCQECTSRQSTMISEASNDVSEWPSIPSIFRDSVFLQLVRSHS